MFKRDAVFIASVLSESTVRSQGGLYDDGWLYRLRVTKVFRGSIGTIVEVFTENGSGRFRLEVGKDYLLFATLHEGRFEIDNCGESGLLAEAATKIVAIEQVQQASTGVIEGRVESRRGKNGVSGVRVSVRGQELTYMAVTDQTGSFRIEVQPGTYRVHIESTSAALIPSFDDPKSLVIPKGGCAQLRFVADEN